MEATTIEHQATPESPLARIAFVFFGTRGDCQPYLALALGLQRRGHAVMIASQESARGFFSDYGFSFVPAGTGLPTPDPSDGEWDENNPVWQLMIAAMAEGSLSKFFAVAAQVCSKGEDDLMTCVHAFSAFKPDLILVGTLGMWLARPISVKMQVPLVEIRLGAFHPNKHWVGLGLPGGPLPCCGLDNLWMHRKVWESGFKAEKQWDNDLKRLLGIEVWQGVTAKAAWDTMLEVPSPCILLGCSRACSEVLVPDLPYNIKFTGFWLLKSEQQTGDAGNSHFGGDETRRQLEDFLAAGGAPVYLGWGSMMCKSGGYMVLLACRALMHSSRRGVICGGWAKLSLEKLRKAASDVPDGSSIVEYAEKNVLFVAKAPHEWLFPRCACTVHHGGAGTIAAALRAGVPTVVTPVLLDQFDHAEEVSRLGVGVGMKQFMENSDADLAAAITKVCTDPVITRQAADLGTKLTAEDGVANAISEIDKIVALIRRGQFLTFVECARKRQAELDERRRCSWCLSWRNKA